MAAGCLCAGESLSTSQTAGPAGGVVSLEAGNRPPETKTILQSPRLDPICPAILAVTASEPHCIAITPQNRALCRGSLSIFVRGEGVPFSQAQGRVLAEALRLSPSRAERPAHKTLRTASKDRQFTLETTSYAGELYIDSSTPE